MVFKDLHPVLPEEVLHCKSLCSHSGFWFDAADGQLFRGEPPHSVTWATSGTPLSDPTGGRRRKFDGRSPTANQSFPKRTRRPIA
ncbi:hypothetical protein F2P81_003689 [Scophthalmus maximus]|uniref:Uncharacterized protein n=1 Tax=Scophthalmus maximus TaxID=52904 RepID=A0A6A4TP25_SCOMX|nr:hypothetical protein F2P81_003689 [Scophthalmus maximus]